MGTRAYICVELTEEDKQRYNTDKQFMGVYCSLMGMMNGGIGETLYKSYETHKKAMRLINHGSIHVLKDFIKDTKFLYKDIRKDDCLAFFNENEIKSTFGAMVAYLYIYRLSEGWRYYSSTNSKRWRDRGLIANLRYIQKRYNKKRN